MSRSPREDAPVTALAVVRRYKAMFDNTWTLATVLASAQVMLCWHLQLTQVSIAPVIWSLATLATLQLALGLASSRVSSVRALGWLAFGSQLLGTALFAIAWHLYGGLQQPLFPLLVVLPLLPGALVFGFWQQQGALLAVLLILSTGMLLSPDRYAFMAANFGDGDVHQRWLPVWMPHSRVAFAEVTTSSAYDLTLTCAMAFIAVAGSTTARALVSLFRHEGERLVRLEGELVQQQHFNSRLVTQSPACEVLLIRATGRIVMASERFCGQFSVTAPAGAFLLDAVHFRYPDVVRRLLQTGGEDVQAAVLNGREQVLRLRAQELGPADAPLSVLCLEPYAEIYWRGELDALEEPLFAVDIDGVLSYPNQSARDMLGTQAEGGVAEVLFHTTHPRWWDIAPLESTRRLVGRDGRQYLASIRRARVSESLSELYFVRLREQAIGSSMLGEPT